MNIAKGRIGEIIVIRLVRGEDMMGCIKKACEEKGINNGVILSVVGSLNGAYYVCPVVDVTKKSIVVNSPPILLESPAQLLAGGGEICHDDNGEIDVHMHATFTDGKGLVYGGHIPSEGNIVMNTLNVFIGIIEGVDMGEEWEELLGAYTFCPKEV